MMEDERTAFVTKEGKAYVPLNYDLQYRGPVLLREALASSYNVVAVKVLDAIGVKTMTGLARRLGITTFDDPERLGLAMTLGGSEVRLLELAAAYAGLANGGRVVQPVAIRAVEDNEGNPLWPARAGLGVRVLDERVAFLITDILSDNLARSPSFGERSMLTLTRPAAVKTGTTTDFRDNWTVGYTPELLAGVWVGNADNEPMREVSGISGAAPIWHDFMEAALQGRPVHRFQRPAGLVEVEVCALSGLLPGPDCPHRISELFLKGTEPVATCTEHQLMAETRGMGTAHAPNTPETAGESQPIPNTAANLRSDTAAGMGQPLGMSNPDEGAVYRLDPSLPRDAQRILVSAQPAPGVSLAEVTLFVDGLPLARLASPPYEALWRLEPGVHLFSAEGLSSQGERVGASKVKVVVHE
jgi:membrane carboxypeptidase/penicillin-binding protein